jgi:hypothetical protein
VSRVALAVVALVGLAGAAPASAIVTRHDRAPAAFERLGDLYPAAVSLNPQGGRGESTLIAAEWLLTAAHVAEHMKPGREIAIDGETYRAAQVAVHPLWRMQPIRHDIALIRLDRAVERRAPAALYRGGEEVGAVAMFVGAGTSGTGLTGPENEDRVRRLATNRVESADSLWVRFRFDAPGDAGATWLEGISGMGDSGGGALVETADGIAVIGVSSWQDTSPTGRAVGRYGVLENYTRVSAHLNWLDEVMGSPPPEQAPAD